MQTVTPNYYRNVKRLCAQNLASYRAARRALLDLRKARIATGRPATGRELLAREDAIDAAIEARFWWRERAKILAGLVAETGAAWSPNGLANVRRAAKRR